MLLDTNAWLDAMGASSLLTREARRHLQEPNTRKCFSSVGVWEIALKSSLGKLTLPFDLVDLDRIFAEQGTEVIDFQVRHAVTAGSIRGMVPEHRNPFDHAIIAIAVCENLPVLTSDTVFERYPVTVIRSRT